MISQTARGKSSSRLYIVYSKTQASAVQAKAGKRIVAILLLEAVIIEGRDRVQPPTMEVGAYMMLATVEAMVEIESQN